MCSSRSASSPVANGPGWLLAVLTLATSELPYSRRTDEPPGHHRARSAGRGARRYDGTIFFVSHDRAFVDALATQVWMVEEPENAAPALAPALRACIHISATTRICAAPRSGSAPRRRNAPHRRTARPRRSLTPQRQSPLRQTVRNPRRPPPAPGGRADPPHAPQTFDPGGGAGRCPRRGTDPPHGRDELPQAGDAARITELGIAYQKRRMNWTASMPAGNRSPRRWRR